MIDHNLPSAEELAIVGQCPPLAPVKALEVLVTGVIEIEIIDGKSASNLDLVTSYECSIVSTKLS